jgi:hypothetical protein
MYDPTIGRWLSEDPKGFEAGDSNLYRYVGNATTNATDPSGLDHIDNRIDARIQRELERQRNSIQGTANGSWPVQLYLNLMLRLNDDDWRETRRGCIGLVNVRLGLRYMSFPLFGNQGVTWFNTYAGADAFRNQLLRNGQANGQPRILALCFRGLTIPPATLAQPGRTPLPSDVDLAPGYDWWVLNEPVGQAPYWEHTSGAWNPANPNQTVIHTPLQDGIQNHGGYPYMIFGVVVTNSPNMPPGPNVQPGQPRP